MPNRALTKKVLIIDDDVLTLDLFKFQLESENYIVSTAENGKQAIELARNSQFDVILTDLNLPDINGIEMVRESKLISPETEIIVVTGDISTEKAVEAIQVGAFDYITKPVDFEKLFVVIRNAIETKRRSLVNAKQAAEIKELRGRLTSRTSYEGIIGSARAMQNIYEIIENVAESDANILILGESGTGKEVIANAIHYKSHRSEQPFVKVNCSALPKDLIESQLFGHTKGSFTGANADKTGFIGQSESGSLMLDEIGEMPIELQPKLLRVLQEKVYYKVGSDKPQNADFRLICATNRSPFDAISEGTLREDLYYRINTIEITIPPLRERMEDVPMLAEHFLHIYSDKYNQQGVAFAQSAYDQMLNYSWRGNVRELQNVIERAVLLSKTGKIEWLDINDSVAGSEPPQAGTVFPVSSGISAPAASISNGNGAVYNGHSAVNIRLDGEPDEVFEEIGRLIVEQLDDPEDGTDQSDVFNFIESGVVLAALKRTRGNKQAAANLLGLYRPRLYGMIKRHNLEERI